MTRSAAIAAAGLFLAASLAGADEPKTATPAPAANVISQPPAPQQDSPLVRAAKAAKKAREKKASADRVITDQSVKKSKGKLTVLSESLPPGAVAPEKAEADRAQQQRDRTQAAAEAEKARVEAEALEKEIARLEQELASIEEGYYDESDVELREDVSQRDFAKTKAALAEARTKLEAARKRQQDAERAASNVFKP